MTTTSSPSAATLAEDTASAEIILSVTDAALAKVLEIRKQENTSETLALRVEITGTSGADFAYDLTFDPVSEAPADARVYQVTSSAEADSDEGDDLQPTELPDLSIMIPAGSVENLTGATLDLPSNPMQGGLVIRNPNKPDLLGGQDLELSGPLAEKLQQLLDRHIYPSLAAHGGFASLVKVEVTVVYISMGGGCLGCAMSAATLREGITAMISQALPEVTQVIDVTDHDAGENPYYS